MTLYIDGQASSPSTTSTFKLDSLRKTGAAALHSPLARRLISYTVLFSSLITFSVSGMQLYRGFNQDLEAIESIVNQVRDSRSDSIVESVWVLDDNLVQIQLDGIANTPDIVAVAIVYNGKELWASGERHEGVAKTYTIPLIKEEHGEVHWLGQLQVTADIQAVRERVRNAAVLVFLANAIKTFFVSFFFIVMFYILIGRHLVAINRFAREYQPGGGIKPLTLERKEQAGSADELFSLVESLNRMNRVIDDYRVRISENERVAVQHASELAIANKELEEFSSRTSHDLRAPIISALALLEVTNESLDADEIVEAKEGIAYAQRSLAKLKVLIDNITQLTIIKKQEENTSCVDFSLLLDESLEILADMEGFASIQINKELHFVGPLLTRKMRLKVIVDNLLSNAIKYYDPSKEQSFIHIKTWNEGNNFVLQVRDNGLGIPEEYEKDLFKMFKRFHNNVSFGSGMGMHLMKSSAEKLGAELTFENPGDGAGFKLVLPMGDKHDN